MRTGNGRGGASGGASDDWDERDEGLADDENFDPVEYDSMLLLERLESLEEEMVEVGVTSLDELRRRIKEMHRQLDGTLDRE